MYNLYKIIKLQIEVLQLYQRHVEIILIHSFNLAKYLYCKPVKHRFAILKGNYIFYHNHTKH